MQLISWTPLSHYHIPNTKLKKKVLGGIRALGWLCCGGVGLIPLSRLGGLVPRGGKVTGLKLEGWVGTDSPTSLWFWSTSLTSINPIWKTGLMLHVSQNCEDQLWWIRIYIVLGVTRTQYMFSLCQRLALMYTGGKLLFCICLLLVRRKCSSF